MLIKFEIVNLLPLILIKSFDNSMKSKWGTHDESYIPLIILNSGIISPRYNHINRQDLIEVFKICKGYTRINANDLFYFDNNAKGSLEAIPVN